MRDAEALGRHLTSLPVEVHLCSCPASACRLLGIVIQMALYLFGVRAQARYVLLR